MKIMNFIIAGVLFFAALYAVPQAVFAQKITEQFEKPMPEFDLLPQAEFDKQTKEFDRDFQKDEALSYKLRVPENWSESSKGGLGDVAVSNKILGELGKFYGPPTLTSRSKLVIEAVGLDYNMTAHQWFVQYLLANGYNLQGLKTHDGNNAEALYVLIEDGVSYAVRSVARVNGKRVVVAQHFVPIERWHDEKVIQAQILRSFVLKNKVQAYVEEMDAYQFLDLAEFKYPRSWALKALPIRSIDRMRVELLSTATVKKGYEKAQTRLDGQVDLALVSIFASETLEEEIEWFRDNLAEKNLTLGELIEVRDDFLLGDRFDFVDTQVFKVNAQTAKLIEHELWLTIMSKGEYYYFISLFTPSRDHDYFTWARNTETYKLIISTIQPQEDEYAVP